MISTGHCRLKRMAQSLLPLPVGPVRISTGGVASVTVDPP